jgi:hypothetical protein
MTCLRTGIFAAFLVAATGSLAAADSGRAIRLVERATTDTVAHIGPKADNLGDILTFANEVFDAANKKRAGTDQGYCVRVVVGKSFQCVWTLRLSGGQIDVSGPFYDAADSVLAVTGGTGAYAGAVGEMRLHARDAKGSAYDFTYVLQAK